MDGDARRRMKIETEVNAGNAYFDTRELRACDEDAPIRHSKSLSPRAADALSVHIGGARDLCCVPTEQALSAFNQTSHSSKLRVEDASRSSTPPRGLLRSRGSTTAVSHEAEQTDSLEIFVVRIECGHEFGGCGFRGFSSADLPHEPIGPGQGFRSFLSTCRVLEGNNQGLSLMSRLHKLDREGRDKAKECLLQVYIASSGTKSIAQPCPSSMYTLPVDFSVGGIESTMHDSTYKCSTPRTQLYPSALLSFKFKMFDPPSTTQRHHSKQEES
ncbi:hypothetical protein DFH08DRAFT_464857 [Mycena albidolilacea]|uniref:Uncharacterized protein n=1 Tax=Mycena albidolilacea TaxID=1033008 RepID=A0AAD7AET1_9AGAR|nr:hypothetical protein DFH08DRAFT_464857 [Mycena albidolilacea]